MDWYLKIWGYSLPCNAETSVEENRGLRSRERELGWSFLYNLMKKANGLIRNAPLMNNHTKKFTVFDCQRKCKKIFVFLILICSNSSIFLQNAKTYLSYLFLFFSFSICGLLTPGLTFFFQISSSFFWIWKKKKDSYYRTVSITTHPYPLHLGTSRLQNKTYMNFLSFPLSQGRNKYFFI